MTLVAIATHKGVSVEMNARIKSSGWAQYVEISAQSLLGAAKRLGVGDWKVACQVSADNPHSMQVRIEGIRTDGPPLRGGNGMVAWVE